MAWKAVPAKPSARPPATQDNPRQPLPEEDLEGCRVVAPGGIAQRGQRFAQIDLRAADRQRQRRRQSGQHGEHRHDREPA